MARSRDNGIVLKYGLKAQKHLALGIALGIWANYKDALKGQKHLNIDAFALSGRNVYMQLKTQGDALS